MIYLYAVAHPFDPARLDGLTGVSGAQVRALRHGDLLAVVSTVPPAEYGEQALRANLEDLAWVEATARAHHRVAGAVAALTATTPVRLATLFHQDERVADLLRERHAEIAEALRQVAGRREWGVKVYAEAGQKPPEAAEPTPDASSPGTAYLRRRISQRRSHEDAARSLMARAEQVHGDLARYAVAFRHHRAQDPRLSGQAGVMLLNSAYLVRDADGEAFTGAAEDLDGRLDGVRIEVTGPWPAYSFASVEEHR